MARLEPGDFPNPHYALIFETLNGLRFPNHPEPGSILVQLNNALISAGHYKNQDNGLRALVNNLTGITGHPQRLPEFTTELITERWRRSVVAYGQNIAEHAESSPESDIVAALGHIEEIRRLYTRTTAGATA